VRPGPERRPPGERLRILHLFYTVNETSAPYNEHCLPLAPRHEIAICSYFPSTVPAPPELALFEGDGSIRGFLRKLDAALCAGPYDVIHAHGPQFWPLLVAASLQRARPTRPLVFTMHGSYPNLQARDRLLWLSLLPFVRRLVLCSKASLEGFPRVGRRLAGRRLSAVANGVDLSRIDRTIAGISESGAGGGFTVVVMGRLIAIKNPLAALEAFLRVADPSSRLVFVGEGPLHQELAARGRALPGQVELVGLVPREDAYRRLRRADLVVSASRGEGLPVAVLEAMACGRPVLLSDIAPHREVAAGAEFIPLVAPDDVPGFAREIERFRSMTRAERVTVGRRCRALVETGFTLEAMHRDYERVYAEVRSERQARRGR
jgi:glycosyltransferase involved in cell wall biosynthesis